MTDFLILYLNAPLLSFGGVAVDNINPTMEFPAKSLLTGLVANALGYDHQDSAKTESLQKRIEYGAMAIKKGIQLQDFQTVDLSQDFLIDTGWTTRGVRKGRFGGNGEGTHIRHREYLAEGDYLIALTLHTGSESPTIQEVEEKLLRPERPLFIGRKCCLPADRIFQTRINADDIEDALIKFAKSNPDKFDENEYTLWFTPQGSDAKKWTMEDSQIELLAVTDERDWTNQIHSGRRLIMKKNIKIEREFHDPKY